MLNAVLQIWLADKHALPIPEGDTHVCRVWFADTGHEYSSKLKGALEVPTSTPTPRHVSHTVHAPSMSQGEERQALWDELAAFLGPEVCHLPRVPTPFAFASAAAAFAAPAACRASAGGEGGGGGCA